MKNLNKILMIVMIIAVVSGCSYFEAQPERISYEYEETSSLCAKLLEYPDRIVILYIDCSRAPESIKRVKHFGASLEEE